MLTRLSIDGLILDVYNTHMQASDSDGENETWHDRRSRCIMG